MTKFSVCHQGFLFYVRYASIMYCYEYTVLQTVMTLIVLFIAYNINYTHNCVKVLQE